MELVSVLSALLHGLLVDTRIEFDLKLHGSAGPCDGHIVDGSLVHGRKRMCVCFPFPCLTLPLDPTPLNPYPPGNLRLMWIHLIALSLFFPQGPPNPFSSNPPRLFEADFPELTG